MAQIRHRVTKASRTLGAGGPLPLRRLPLGARQARPGPRALPRRAHPGAAFLDVERDLSAPAVEGGARHPLPDSEAFAEAARRAKSSPAWSWWPTARAAAPNASGGCSATSATKAAVLQGGIDAWAGPLTAGEEEIEDGGLRDPPRARTTRSTPTRSPRGSATRRWWSSTPGSALPRRAEPDRPRPGPDPGRRVNVPWTAEDELPARLLEAGGWSSTAARASPPASRCTRSREQAGRTRSSTRLVERLGVEETSRSNGG